MLCSLLPSLNTTRYQDEKRKKEQFKKNNFFFKPIGVNRKENHPKRIQLQHPFLSSTISTYSFQERSSLHFPSVQLTQKKKNQENTQVDGDWH